MKPRIPKGGCQCGAVRYEVRGGFGRASLCHCRMCQKAFGNAFGPLVTAYDLSWVQGHPSHFRSSNRVRRGFCRDCGTPLTYEPDGYDVELAFCTLDDPTTVVPSIQVGLHDRLAWLESVAGLATLSDADTDGLKELFATIVSYQYPDDSESTR